MEKKSWLTEKALIMSASSVVMLWTAFIISLFGVDISGAMPVIYTTVGLTVPTAGFAYDRKKKTDIAKINDNDEVIHNIPQQHIDARMAQHGGLPE